MNKQVKSPKQALSPAFLKQKPKREEIDRFKNEFIKLLDRINEKESEEYNKNLITAFLNDVYYKDKYFINTSGRADLVVHNGKDTNLPVGVLIETKSPASNKTEMVSRENLNVKSFQQLVLYYLRERKTNKNFELRYLIITNVYEWFVFDAQEFEKLFYENKRLLKNFEQFETGSLSGTKTDLFYKEIAAPAIEELKDKISYTHFDIRHYDKIVRSTDKENDKALVALYQFLSPNNLLKIPFEQDANSLNAEFYAELLHILGLEEVKRGGQKFIERKKIGERDSASMLENAIEIIERRDLLDKIDKQQLGETRDEQLFALALNLTITWINRILFLKLLEAQIIKYNKSKDFAFLTPEMLPNYGEIERLFFDILAKKQEERRAELKEKFAHVPYLNSSLFEITEYEDKGGFIAGLDNNVEQNLYAKSVLRGRGEPVCSPKMRPLEYLLRFLDAYDFNNESSEDIQDENKTLISASVLGLIFEKINGYKDGSFFTPAFITMYMCRETISRAVIQKFNETKKWNCQSIEDLYNKIDDRKEANLIFNQIRICDPAVGSGHFLVSALNEMLRLKFELGILIDDNGKRLRDYNIFIENDELTITDEDNNPFNYNPNNKESQRIQELLFREKRIIIENCLFGVDINPNSVKICQLRLWIELLKNTYYRAGTNELETLPNIDINIKCGNSLLSRFGLDDKNVNLAPLAKEKIKQATQKYKKLVPLYKACEDKKTKDVIVSQINEIRNFYQQINNAKDADYQALQKAKSELAQNTQSFNFFETETNEWNDKTAELTEKVQQLEKQYNEKIRGCFEWRFEFPEILDDDGNFVGFDVVIGNPPYVSVKEISNKDKLLYLSAFKTAIGQFDLYGLFFEKSFELLKNNGFLSFITSNTFLNNKDFAPLRKYMLHNSNIQSIANLDESVFESAKVDVAVTNLRKDKPITDNKIKISRNKNEFLNEIFDLILQEKFNNAQTDFEFKLNCTQIDFEIIEKMYQNKTLLSSIMDLPRGIEIGANSDLISTENTGSLDKLLVGKDISRYDFAFKNRFIEFDNQNKSNFKDISIYQSEKILIQRIRNLSLKQRLVCCYDNEGYLCTNTLRIGILKTTDFSLKFILGILNSKLINYLFLKYFLNKDIYAYQLEQIPIPQTSTDQQQPIINLVNEILAQKKANSQADTSALEKEIDNLVYGLYGLSEEEMEIIEK